MLNLLQLLAKGLSVTLLVCASASELSRLSGPSTQSGRTTGARPPVERTIGLILRADYEDDRAALKRLASEIPLASSDGHLSSRMHYWRGFAMWRRALNGFNDSAERADIELDLHLAIAEFEAAVANDGTFVDAKIAEVSCLQNLTFIHQNEASQVAAFVARFVPLFKESVAAEPDNPRVIWVQGASQWYSAPGLSTAEVDARQTAALAIYARGLRVVRAQRPASTGPLEPSWGEPELLMNLAWSNLHTTRPDVPAAEAYATQALALVPYWHYVRDILLVQIIKAKGGGHAPSTLPPVRHRAS